MGRIHLLVGLELKTLPESPCKDINCNNNNIRIIINKLNIRTLRCRYNKIRIIKNCPDLEKIHAEYNRIKSVSYFPKIVDFRNDINKIKDHSRFISLSGNKYLLFLYEEEEEN